MSIREEIGLKDLETQLERYSDEEDYLRYQCGLDEQDEHTHLVCSKQRQLENEIENTEDKYEKEMHQIAKKMIADVSKYVTSEIGDMLRDYATNYTDDGYEQDLLSDYALDDIEIIIQTKYKDKEQKLFNTTIRKHYTHFHFTEENLTTLRKYCEEESLIKTFDEVLQENLKKMDIQCPIEFLNVDKIVYGDKSYIIYGKHFLKISVLHNELMFGKFQDMV